MKKNLLNSIGLFILFSLLFLFHICSEPTDVKAESTIWDGCTATQFSGGDGTKENPYQIANGAQLALLASNYNKSHNYSPLYYTLTNDIALNNTDNWENWTKNSPANSWKAIGRSWHYFNGVFDGAGHVISGLYCKDKNEAGLFGKLSNNGIIKNVKMEKSYTVGNALLVQEVHSGTVDNCKISGILRAAGDYIGAVVGYNYNKGTITNCVNTSKLFWDANYSFGPYYYLGGIVGFNAGTISNCTNTSNIIGNTNKNNEIGISIGGITGANHGEILTSSNFGSLSAADNSPYLGGITGTLSKGSLIDCENSGIISNTSESKYTGGIVGYMHTGTIQNCINKGNIKVQKSSKYIGGILGGQDWYHKDSLITNCSNYSVITAPSNSEHIAGIAGQFQNKINNSINLGNIKCIESSSIGGIVGSTLFGIISNSSNIGNISASNSNTIGGIAGSLGAFAILADNVPNAVPKIANCSNLGNIVGSKSAYIGGIVGESYKKSYNSYNSGIITGNYCVGGIIGRTTLGKNNIPSNCFYLKGCAKIVNPLYDFENKPNNYGFEWDKKRMQSNSLSRALNNWVNNKSNTLYSQWTISWSKTNNHYPKLIVLKK